MDRLGTDTRPRFGVERVGAGHYRVVGDLDLSTAGFLEAQLETDPCPSLILDLSELTFLDSAGMRVVLRAIVQGRSVTLRAPSPSVERTVRTAGVDRLPGLRVEA
jgi:anti-anti-sigma factor